MKTKYKSNSLADVARLAGVSISTASRVLSNSNYPVAIKTREKIMLAAKKLNYVTSAIGRAMATQRTRTIAFIISDISTPFFTEIVRSAEETCQNFGYIITLLSHERDTERELQFFRFLRSFKPDGIIIGSCSANRQHMQNIYKEIELISSIGIPVISLQRHLLPISTVCVDCIELTRFATNHLLALGHRDIVFITGEPGWIVTEDRLAGYQRALEFEGITVDPNLIICGNWKDIDTYNAVNQLIKKGAHFTGVVASNDTMAISAMKALMDAGMKIPEDVSVVGINNNPITKFYHPALTTISIPMRELGIKSIRMVIDFLENDVSLHDVTLPSELKIRQSTAPVKI